MKISLATHYFPTVKEDYQELADLTIPNRAEFCKRWGYSHMIQIGSYFDSKWYYGFQRLKWIRDEMDKASASDFYWILNVSSLITNMTRRIEDFLDDEHDCWLTKDVHGINLGSFILRNTAWCKKWLDFIVSQEPAYRAAVWTEQKCVMDWWMHEDWTWKIHLLPQRSINSYLYQLYPPWPNETPGNWRSGDLALSLPGTNLEQRMDIVKRVLDETSRIIIR